MAEANILNKAFDGICLKVEKALSQQGFARQNVSSDNNSDRVALFTNDAVAYSVYFNSEKHHMMLRSCAMTEDGPDNEWKNLATWLFDPQTDKLSDADSIGKDFSAMLEGESQIKKVQQAKKKKKKRKDDGNADPEFLAKRFVTFFPELKDEITEEVNNYYPFRGVTFTKKSILPKLSGYVKTANKKQLEKLGQLLSRQYSNGDIDTRSIITIVIINSFSEGDYNKLYDYFDEDLQKASKAARKYIGKTVKPEKIQKKKRSFVADTLRDMQK
ncbi:MAG: hypothetical protein IJV39_00865 [Ruminococcus sp.]|nr:hypothetical protein [Ruminococcus sp.]